MSFESRVEQHRNRSKEELLAECRLREIEFNARLAERVCTDPNVNVAFRLDWVRWDTTIEDFVNTIAPDHQVEVLAHYIEEWRLRLRHWTRSFARVPTRIASDDRRLSMKHVMSAKISPEPVSEERRLETANA